MRFFSQFEVHSAVQFFCESVSVYFVPDIHRPQLVAVVENAKHDPDVFLCITPHDYRLLYVSVLLNKGKQSTYPFIENGRARREADLVTKGAEG